MKDRKRKKKQPPKKTLLRKSNTSVLHLEVGWEKILDNTTTPATTPLPCVQSEEDGTGKNLLSYWDQAYIIAGTTSYKHLNEFTNHLLTDSSAFLPLLLQLQAAQHAFRPAFSFNNSSTTHVPPQVLFCWAKQGKHFHSPNIGSPFLQAFLLIFSIMNAFLVNTNDKLHMILQILKFLQARNLSPDTSSNHICLFCTCLVLLVYDHWWSCHQLIRSQQMHLSCIPEMSKYPKHAFN